MEIQINIDCDDVERMTSFYGAAFGYQVHATAGQYASMTPPAGDTGPKLVFQKVPEAKSVKNRVHLDVIVDDIEAEALRYVALGATRGQKFEEFGLSWIVMADPEGNEVCLCDG